MKAADTSRLQSTKTENGMSKIALVSLDKFFYFTMSWLVLAVVAYGFVPTLGERLLHPPAPRPLILYGHAIIFTSWVFLFIVQSTFVRAANIRWHRRLGVAGVVLGGILPLYGTATAIVMQDWDSASFLSLPFNDMLTFAISFGLAIYWRRKPEFHRRLMIIASCCLTGAAFARFPSELMPFPWFYAGVDLLILLGVLRDLVVNRKVHVVYRHGLPAMMIAQALSLYLFLGKPAVWLTFVHLLVRQGGLAGE
jgi:hypothetical protein